MRRGTPGCRRWRRCPTLPAGLPSDLLAERPDIRAAEQQLIAANANIGAARAAFFPRITLTALDRHREHRVLGPVQAAASKAWTFAPQITLPIFDAGRNQADLDSARAEPRHRGGAVREVDPDRVPRGRRRAGRPRHASTSSCARCMAQADAEGVRSKLSDLRYRNGVASCLDLLDAQRSLFTSQLATAQTRLAQLQNQVTLYKALGGGWATR